MCFNPRSLAGSDLAGFWRWQLDAVSIHAPLRGATRQRLRRGAGSPVSIHAPLRGATELAAPKFISQEVSIHAPLRGATPLPRRPESPSTFQSTLPCGERPCGRGCAETAEVSIHAPLRGATGHRARERLADPFQSTLPCGERLSTIHFSRQIWRFNPRSLAGSDDARKPACEP